MQLAITPVLKLTTLHATWLVLAIHGEKCCTVNECHRVADTCYNHCLSLQSAHSYNNLLFPAVRLSTYNCQVFVTASLQVWNNLSCHTGVHRLSMNCFKRHSTKYLTADRRFSAFEPPSTLVKSTSTMDFATSWPPTYPNHAFHLAHPLPIKIRTRPPSFAVLETSLS